MALSAYMQSHGYRIVPVNPNIDECLGQKSLPILARGAREDRHRQYLPTLRICGGSGRSGDQVESPAVWMQEEVIHEKAADKARQAGIFVVMDRCILKEHRGRFR